nr:site-specific integrase [Halomicroarcula limicola]
MGVSRSETYKEIRYIEIEDYEKLLDVIDDTRDLLIVQILWNCGVRAQELVNIRVSDITDFNGDDDNGGGGKDRSIKIETAKQDGYEDRMVYYPPSVERTLKKWLEGGTRNGYLRANESDYLILGESSEDLHPNRPTEIIHDYAEEAGIQAKVDKGPNAAGTTRNTVTAHAFRHSFAVHRVRNGMPIVFLSDLLGHSDITQTREYLRFRKEDIKEAEKKYRP